MAPAGGGARVTAGMVTSQSLDAAFERWSYGEGFTAGRVEGRRVGFVEGYGAGFDAGAEVGAARVLLAVEHVLDRRLGELPELLPLLPHVGGYLDFRARTVWTDEPCDRRCDRCSACVRAAAAVVNRARYGRADFPGAAGARSTTGRWL